MNIENVKGVVWDLDGTLLDSFGIFEQIIGEVIEESGHSMPTNEYMLHNYHGSLEDTVQRILGIKSSEELDTIISSFLKKQEHYYAGDLNTHLFKDATNLAKQIASQEIPQLLVTNRYHEGRGTASPRFIIAATVLADCIKEIYPGDQVEYRKPDKRSVGDWLERTHIIPREVIVIGDQFVDAQLALNLGCRAILINRNGEIPHLDNLSENNHEDIITVDSLDNVQLFK